MAGISKEDKEEGERCEGGKSCRLERGGEGKRIKMGRVSEIDMRSMRKS